MEDIFLLREASSLLASIFRWIHSVTTKKLYYQIFIESGKAFLSYRACVEELKDAEVKSDKVSVVDLGFSQKFEPENNTYYMFDSIVGWVSYVVDQDTITIFKRKYCTSVTQDQLFEYFKRIVAKWNSPSVINKFFVLDNMEWNPIFREPRNLDSLKITEKMNSVLDSVEEFISSEEKYDEKGFAYRKGYLLYGKPNTGKTSLIELIARKFDMAVYMIYFNSKDMTDALLIRMINDIPERSLLIFEEIDKQIESLDNKHVSMGGLLTALDGPQRLPRGTIVIMTSNSKDFVKEHSEPFFRAGRIDCCIEL